jgi:hypothetical protein
VQKENQELKTKLQEQKNLQNLELQSKRARDAKAWFRENWREDQLTTLLDYTDHYNKQMNKCFIMVEYHYKLAASELSWYNDMTLWDVYENLKYANYSESHEIHKVNNYTPVNTIFSCDVPGAKCKSLEEWNKAVNSYMSD